VRIERKFGFAGDVEIRLIAPEGAAIEAEGVQIAADESRGTILIRVDAGVAPGLYACQLEASLNFNGIDVHKQVPLAVVVPRGPPFAEGE
jgi:hypothetical protein